MIPGKIYTPQDVLKAAWRRRWWMVLPFVAISALSLAYAYSLSYRYQSVATIQVLPPPVPEVMVPTTVQSRIEDRLSSLNERILTRSRLEVILQEFGLYAELRTAAPMESVIERMRGDVVFNPVEKDVFEVGYTHGDPAVALRVASRLAQTFIEETARDRENLANQATGFIETELESARLRLEEAERNVETYKKAHSGELPSQQAANMQSLAGVQQQLQAIQDAANRDRDQRSLLLRQLDDARQELDPELGPVTVAPSSDLNALEGGSATEQLEKARVTLRALELRLTPEHPDVVRQKRLIERLEVKAQAEAKPASGKPVVSAATQARNRRVRDLEQQIAGLDRLASARSAEEQRLRASIGSYQGRIEASPVREAELASLTRDHDSLRKLYGDLLQKRENAKLAASLERRDAGDRFRMIEPPRLPEKPHSPSRRKFFIIGVLAGLMFGLMLAAFMEFRDSTFRTDDDIQAGLGLPVLATVPVLGPQRAAAAAGGASMSTWLLAIALAVVTLGLAVVSTWARAGS